MSHTELVTLFIFENIMLGEELLTVRDIDSVMITVPYFKLLTDKQQ